MVLSLPGSKEAPETMILGHIAFVSFFFFLGKAQHLYITHKQFRALNTGSNTRSFMPYYLLPIPLAA